MLRIIILVLIITTGSIYSDKAYSQGIKTVTCESYKFGLSTCNTSWNGPSLILEQLSSSACVEGQSWGENEYGSIWVSHGCRAVFTARYTPKEPVNGLITCESYKLAEETCYTPWNAASLLIRQLSKSSCIEGQTWGQRGPGAIWVSDGCRAQFARGRGFGDYLPPPSIAAEEQREWERQQQEFEAQQQREIDAENARAQIKEPEPLPPARVFIAGKSASCSSNGLKKNNCVWKEEWGIPFIKERLSAAACYPNRDWGYENNTIWVKNGCNAKFEGK